MRREHGRVLLSDLPSKMSKLKVVGEDLTEEERLSLLSDSYEDMQLEVDFEVFLRVSVTDCGGRIVVVADWGICV